MRRLLISLILVTLCLCPRPAAGQQASYSRVSRLVGAIRTAALISAPSAASHALGAPGILPVLPPLGFSSSLSRRRVLRLRLTERLQFRASTYWLSSGLTGTIGLGVRF
jgi:hypothetical protein